MAFLGEPHPENRVPAEPPGGTAGPRVVLEVIAGPHQGQFFEFDQHETLLAGRSSAAQLRLNQDPHFSRHHFRLEVNPPMGRLIDLDSMNGTFVNGQRIRETTLQPSDIISGGTTRIQFSVAGVQPEAPYDLPTAIFFGDAGTAGNSSPVINANAESQPTELDQRIPGFELQEELGRGGMGIVYRAVQKSSGRVLALKLMKPALAANSERLRFFVREASILSQLNHPNIVRFFAMGTTHGEFFVATEYVKAIPLENLFNKLPKNRRK